MDTIHRTSLTSPQERASRSTAAWNILSEAVFGSELSQQVQTENPSTALKREVVEGQSAI